AIVIWVNQDSRFEGTHTKLLGELVKVGQKHGVDTQSKAWPKGAAQLSRRVNDLVPLLRKAGVVVTTGRKPGGERFVVLEHVHLCQNMPEDGDDAEHTSSQAASVDKSHHPKQMCRIDVFCLSSNRSFPVLELA
ncbi:MAG TPA: hypothetical protein PLS24_07255, partial [Sedimentisphaerales bacterium]|nr:hypothetical protein [Sedimentisphaerales bacterium]